MARRGRGPAWQPHGQPGYGQPGYGQPGYGQPGQPGYGPGQSFPGQYPGHPGPPAPPPRRSKLKPILGWTGVVVGGIISTVVATMIVDAVTDKDDKKPAVTQAGGEPAGPPLPEGYVAPSGAPVVNGPKFNSTADTRSWPDACDMVTDLEIKNAIPDATPRRRTGEEYDGSLRGANRPMRDIGCTIELVVPNLRTQSNPATIKVSIVTIGDPEQVKTAFMKEKASDGQRSGNIDGLFEDLENRLGVDSAYRQSTTLNLLEGGYWITLNIRADTVDTQGQSELQYSWLKRVAPSLVAILNVKMQND